MPKLRRRRHPKSSNTFLWVRGGIDDGKTIRLAEGISVMGRASDNAVVIEDGGVSRQHAAIRVDSGTAWIEDLGSKNGTRVNGAEVGGEGQRFKDKDQIELGGVETPVWIFRDSSGTIQK